MEAHAQEERRIQARRAVEVCALVYGYRSKKPSLGSVMRWITQDPLEREQEEDSEIAQESRRRAAGALEKKQRKWLEKAK